jgi:hypothetical protein
MGAVESKTDASRSAEGAAQSKEKGAVSSDSADAFDRALIDAVRNITSFGVRGVSPASRGKRKLHAKGSVTDQIEERKPDQIEERKQRAASRNAVREKLEKEISELEGNAEDLSRMLAEAKKSQGRGKGRAASSAEIEKLETELKDMKAKLEEQKAKLEELQAALLKEQKTKRAFLGFLSVIPNPFALIRPTSEISEVVLQTNLFVPLVEIILPMLLCLIMTQLMYGAIDKMSGTLELDAEYTKQLKQGNVTRLVETGVSAVSGAVGVIKTAEYVTPVMDRKNVRTKLSFFVVIFVLLVCFWHTYKDVLVSGGQRQGSSGTSTLEIDQLKRVLTAVARTDMPTTVQTICAIINNKVPVAAAITGACAYASDDAKPLLKTIIQEKFPEKTMEMYLDSGIDDLIMLVDDIDDPLNGEVQPIISIGDKTLRFILRRDKRSQFKMRDALMLMSGIKSIDCEKFRNYLSKLPLKKEKTTNELLYVGTGYNIVRDVITNVFPAVSVSAVMSDAYKAEDPNDEGQQWAEKLSKWIQYRKQVVRKDVAVKKLKEIEEKIKEIP